MLPVYLHDKAEIEAFLRQKPYLHLYELGDLDDFFWPYTTWIAEKSNGAIRSLLLLYSGGGLPVVLAIAQDIHDSLEDLLLQACRQPLLPSRFYCHFSPGLAPGVAAEGYRLESHGFYYKMALVEKDQLDRVDTSRVRHLTPLDESALVEMYDSAYPGNWFDPRMLETGCYYGVWLDGRVVSAAGIHVYSPAYRAAALGNICTSPDVRRQGLGTAVTARVCQALLETTDTIGLNVRADNAAALAAYTRLGFRVIAQYEEYMVTYG